MSPKDENYIARLTAYISENLSEDHNIELQDSITFVLSSASFRQITDFESSLYKKNLSEIYSVFKAEFNEQMALYNEVYDREIRAKKAIMRGVEDYEAGNVRTLSKEIH